MYVVKGVDHFFKTLSVGSVHGTDYSQMNVFFINTCFQAEKFIYIPLLVLPRVENADARWHPTLKSMNAKKETRYTYNAAP